MVLQGSGADSQSSEIASLEDPGACVCVCVCVCMCVCVGGCGGTRIVYTFVHAFCVYIVLAKKIADEIKKITLLDLHTTVSDPLPDFALLECVGFSVLTRLVETKPLWVGDVCV